MPCATFKFEPAGGMRLPIGLAKPISLFPDQTEPVRIEEFMALLDTGASKTCVTGEIANKLALPLMGKTEMISASEMTPTNVYLVDFFLPFGQPGKSPEFRVPDLPVMEFNGGGSVHILLGMDVLQHMVLNVTAYDNRFTLCI